ncbi:MAG: DUF2934 domain-containing protein [Isosphaeraceae bacterium]
MIPARELVERAAYDRWQRRGMHHGADREDWVAAEQDVFFALNYETVAEYQLSGGAAKVIGNVRRPRCRFCEQSPPRASFSYVRHALPEELGNVALSTREICDECADQFNQTIDKDFQRFWESLAGPRGGTASLRELRAPLGLPIPAYKALIRMALSIIPEEELPSFTDTIEWVGNPDHEFDSGLFGGVGCLLYQVHAPWPGPWTSLTRRVDEDAPLPYMLFFLGSGRVVLQLHLPLCSQDQDLDGMEARMPELSFSTGIGFDLRAAACVALPLNSPARASRPVRFRLF